MAHLLILLTLILQTTTEWVEISQQHYRKPVRVSLLSDVFLLDKSTDNKINPVINTKPISLKDNKTSKTLVSTVSTQDLKHNQYFKVDQPASYKKLIKTEAVKNRTSSVNFNFEANLEDQRNDPRPPGTLKSSGGALKPNRVYINPQNINIPDITNSNQIDYHNTPNTSVRGKGQVLRVPAKLAKVEPVNKSDLQRLFGNSEREENANLQTNPSLKPIVTSPNGKQTKKDNVKIIAIRKDGSKNNYEITVKQTKTPVDESGTKLKNVTESKINAHLNTKTSYVKHSYERNPFLQEVKKSSENSNQLELLRKDSKINKKYFGNNKTDPYEIQENYSNISSLAYKNNKMADTKKPVYIHPNVEFKNSSINSENQAKAIIVNVVKELPAYHEENKDYSKLLPHTNHNRRIYLYSTPESVTTTEKSMASSYEFEISEKNREVLPLDLPQHPEFITKKELINSLTENSDTADLKNGIKPEEADLNIDEVLVQVDEENDISVISSTEGIIFEEQVTSEEVPVQEEMKDDILETKVNPVDNLIKFMTVISETISRGTNNDMKSKMNYLKNLKDNLMFNIENRIDTMWPDDSPKRRRRRQARGHVDFPSSEGALMSISFLTFAVFLIKLVLQVMHTYKSPLVVAPTVFAVSRAADTLRHAAHQDHA